MNQNTFQISSFEGLSIPCIESLIDIVGFDVTERRRLAPSPSPPKLKRIKSDYEEDHHGGPPTATFTATPSPDPPEPLSDSPPPLYQMITDHVGSSHVIYRNYVYRPKRSLPDIWRCAELDYCQATCTIDRNSIQTQNRHVHLPEMTFDTRRPRDGTLPLRQRRVEIGDGEWLYGPGLGTLTSDLDPDKGVGSETKVTNTALAPEFHNRNNGGDHFQDGRCDSDNLRYLYDSVFGVNLNGACEASDMIPREFGGSGGLEGSLLGEEIEGGANLAFQESRSTRHPYFPPPNYSFYSGAGHHRTMRDSSPSINSQSHPNNAGHRIKARTRNYTKAPNGTHTSTTYPRSQFKFVHTTRGNKLLIQGGFTFRIRQAGSRRWRCSEKGCPGKALVSADDVLHVTEGHSHAPNPDKVLRKELVSDLICGIRRCRNESQVQELYHKHTSDLPISTASCLPNLATVRHMFRNYMGSERGCFDDTEADEGSPVPRPPPSPHPTTHLHSLGGDVAVLDGGICYESGADQTVLNGSIPCGVADGPEPETKELHGIIEPPSSTCLATRQSPPTEAERATHPIKYITTLNGNRQIIYSGYNYRMRSPDSKYWRCSESGCPGKCYVDDERYGGDVITLTRAHNHQPNRDKIFRKEFLSDLASGAARCRSDSDAEALLATLTTDLPVSSKALLPPTSVMKQMIRRVHGASSYLPSPEPRPKARKLGAPLLSRTEGSVYAMPPFQPTGSLDLSDFDSAVDGRGALTGQRNASPTDPADISPERCRYIRNLHGHLQVVHRGYNYRLRSEGLNRWRCVESSCRGKCSVYAHDSIIVTCEHDHPPYPHKVLKKELLGRILCLACQDPLLDPDHVIVSATKDLSPATLSVLPPLAVVKQMVERARSTNFGANGSYEREATTPTSSGGIKGSIDGASSSPGPNLDASVLGTDDLVSGTKAHDRVKWAMVDTSDFEPNGDVRTQLPYKFIMSLKGSKQIVHQGYNYRLRAPCKNRWRCVETGCLGSCFVDGRVIQITQVHNHLPKTDKVAKKEILGSLVYHAVVVEPHTQAEALIEKVTSSLSPDLRSALPSFATLLQLITRLRSSTGFSDPTGTGDSGNAEPSLNPTCQPMGSDPSERDLDSSSISGHRGKAGADFMSTTTSVNFNGSPEPMRYAVDQDGRLYAAFRGHLYHQRKPSNKYWRCARSKDCPGKVLINGGQIRPISQHDHPAPFDENATLDVGEYFENFDSFDVAGSASTTSHTTAILQNGCEPLGSVTARGSLKYDSPHHVTLDQMSHRKIESSFMENDSHDKSITSPWNSLDKIKRTGSRTLTDTAHNDFKTNKYLYLRGFILALEYDLSTRSEFIALAELGDPNQNQRMESHLKRVQDYNKILHLPLKQKCSRCPFSTESAIVLDDHVRKPHWKRVVTRGDNHTTLVRCPYCSFQSPWLPLMNEHLKVHHSIPNLMIPVIEPFPRAFQCPICPYEVDLKKNWVHHVEKCINRKGNSQTILSLKENFSAYFPCTTPHTIKSINERSLLNSRFSPPGADGHGSTYDTPHPKNVLKNSQSIICQPSPTQVGAAKYDSNLRPLVVTIAIEGLASRDPDAVAGTLGTLGLPPTGAVPNFLPKGAPLKTDDPKTTFQSLANNLNKLVAPLIRPRADDQELRPINLVNAGCRDPDKVTVYSSALASAHFLLTTHGDRLAGALKRLIDGRGEGGGDVPSPLPDNSDHYLDHLIPSKIYELYNRARAGGLRDDVE